MGATRIRVGTAVCLLGAVTLVAGACTTGTPEETMSASAPSASPPDASGTSTTAASPSLETLQRDVLPLFEERSFDEPEADLPVGYNLFLPEGFDSEQSYPMVLFVSDSTRVGDAVPAPSTQYGALVWASPQVQAQQPLIVVVPQYPDLVVADLEGRGTTDYVDLTARLVRAVQEDLQVDKDRTYATGQGLGAATVLQLAAQEPELFAAELLVGGQGGTPDAGGLAQQSFVSVATDGDDAAQDQLRSALDAADETYGTAAWDATWPSDRLAQAATELLTGDDDAYLVTIEGAPTPTATTGVDARPAFQQVYEIGPLRDWLLAQD
jgi:predicted peptidase